MHDVVSTGDIYECVYYVLGGCDLLAIEGVLVNGKVSCTLSFKGEDIARLQVEYFQGKATVNLFDFRRTYSQVNAWIAGARKQLKTDLEKKHRGEGGTP